MKQNLQQTSKTIFKHTQPFLLGSSQLSTISQAIQTSNNRPLIQIWETFEPAIEADFEIIESYQEEPNDADNQSDVRGIFRRFLKANERLVAKIEKLIEALETQKAASTKMVINNHAPIDKQLNINDNYGTIRF